ncbi:MAG: hypothetical protein KKE00_13025 [Proteobacteria bacterium]|nr:hypothetical protein [Pseudomonadota bacterium]MBU1397425.1 hypothetical protein [Pseudomonadota bacterium]MBU1571414.1 hypothetical protein [Pseudomonadota bacterium]
MGYFSRKLEKTVTFAASLLISKRKYHTLILLGDDGKVKHIRIIRGMIIALLLVQIVILCSGAYLFSSGMRFVEDKKIMEKELIIAQKNYLIIRDEKDMLMARLVLAESLVNKETGGAGVSKTATTSAKASAAQIPLAPVNSGRVSIDNINVFHEAGANRLKIQFDLKSNHNSKQVSGYSFVILKENDIDEAGWLPVPFVSLVSKRPTAVNKGRYFSTSKFTTVNLTTNIRSVPPRFKLVTVFLYSVSGELLLEKDFPVSLRVKKEI